MYWVAFPFIYLQAKNQRTKNLHSFLNLATACVPKSVNYNSTFQLNCLHADSHSCQVLTLATSWELVENRQGSWSVQWFATRSSFVKHQHTFLPFHTNLYSLSLVDSLSVSDCFFLLKEIVQNICKVAEIVKVMASERKWQEFIKGKSVSKIILENFCRCVALAFFFYK